MEAKKSLNKEKAQDDKNEEYLAQMGFTFDEHGHYELNANIFSEFFLEHVKLIIFQDNFFYRYKNGVWQPTTDRQVTRTIRNVINRAKPDLYQRQMGINIVEMLKLAAPEKNRMDTHSKMINLLNGMIDLESYRIIAHSPDYYSTVQIPMIYGEEAQCPKFLKFLHEIFEDDAERISLIQELMGYILTSETKVHKAFFFHGEGANGKSVLLEIISMLAGRQNVSNLSLKDLEKPFNRAVLIGKTLNIATENEVSSRGFNSQFLKAIVSGDSIMVEKKYQDAFSYSPICKLIFATNNLPASLDCSYGFYRRIVIIPFNKRFTAETADVYLKKKLEEELPGILNWSLAGLKRLRQQKYNFSQSELVDNAFSRYQDDQNPMPDYVLETLMYAPGSRINKGDIVDRYYDWCKGNGIYNESKLSPQKFWSTFKSSFKECGLVYNEKSTNGIRYLKDITLKKIN